MITVQLMGGLGNQLFQIAVTIATAMQHKVPFYFVNSTELAIGRPRPTYWKSMCASLQPFLKSSMQTDDLIRVREQSYSYNAITLPTPVAKTGNIVLFGYYQSYKYFEQHYKTISTLLRLNAQLCATQSMYNYDYDNTIALHIRRDDYKHLTDTHPILNSDYYIKALSHIIGGSKLTDMSPKPVIRRVLVFGQQEDAVDINEFVSELTVSQDIVVEIIDYTIPDHQQILCMALCHHYIVANSSFSWWAAFIGTNNTKHTDKIICYPSKWFGPASNNDTSSLFPPTWTCISAD